jgi:hypothetical protein
MDILKYLDERKHLLVRTRSEAEDAEDLHSAQFFAGAIAEIGELQLRLEDELQTPPAHLAVPYGQCPVCGHYGQDCAGVRE